MKSRINLISFITFFVILLGLQTQFASAQTVYRAGYIINSANDTINTEVAFRINEVNYSSVIYKVGDTIIKALPNELKGYGIFSGKSYSSGVLPNVFVEILVTGKISLFRYGNKYVVKKDSLTDILFSEYVERKINGRTVVVEDEKWRNILAFYTNDCFEDSYAVVKKTNLSEVGLITLIVDYNKCAESNYSEYQIQKSHAKLNFGLSTSLKGSYYRVSDNRQLVGYLPTRFSSLDYSVGATLTLVNPRLSEKSGLQIDLNFSSYTINSNSSYNNLLFYHTLIKYNSLSIPVSIYYARNGLEKGFIARGGISYDQLIRRNTTVSASRLINGSMQEYVKRPAFELSPFQIGGFIGYGYYVPANRCNLELFSRLSYHSNLNSSSLSRINNYRLALGATIFRK